MRRRDLAHVALVEDDGDGAVAQGAAPKLLGHVVRAQGVLEREVELVALRKHHVNRASVCRLRKKITYLHEVVAVSRVSLETLQWPAASEDVNVHVLFQLFGVTADGSLMHRVYRYINQANAKSLLLTILCGSVWRSLRPSNRLCRSSRQRKDLAHC